MNTTKSKKINYPKKFESFRDKTLFEKMDIIQQEFIKNIAFEYKFTFQEFRQIVEAARDLELWQENDLKSWWQNKFDETNNQNKKTILYELKDYLNQLKSQPSIYPVEGLLKP